MNKWLNEWIKNELKMNKELIIEKLTIDWMILIVFLVLSQPQIQQQAQVCEVPAWSEEHRPHGVCLCAGRSQEVSI